MARKDLTWTGEPRPGSARRGVARKGESRREQTAGGPTGFSDVTRLSACPERGIRGSAFGAFLSGLLTAGRERACEGEARQSTDRLGEAGRSLARDEKASVGKARTGLARRGTTGRDEVRRGVMHRQRTGGCHER